MTWAAQRVQYGRLLKSGATPAEAKEAPLRCQKCLTLVLRLLRRSEARLTTTFTLLFIMTTFSSA